MQAYKRPTPKNPAWSGWSPEQLARVARCRSAAMFAPLDALEILGLKPLEVGEVDFAEAFARECFCFTTSSKGGLACMNSLTRTYGRRVQNEKVPGLPIVELKADSYKHRRYGKIFTPQMIVVEWTGADGRPLSLADDLNDEIAI
jgi:hypothetical protein